MDRRGGHTLAHLHYTLFGRLSWAMKSKKPTMLLIIGAREVKVEKVEDDALRLPTSRANLLASHVAVLVSLEEVEGAMMKVKAARASTILKALTLLMREAETPKYKASWFWMFVASLVLVRKVACEVDKRAPAT